MMKQLSALGLAVALAANVQADAFKPSKADQVKLGSQASAEVRKKEKVLPARDERVIVLRRVAQKLLATVDDSKEPWKYSFDVIDNKEVNAFALPGGPVYFFTGLLSRFKTEDQLAAVLAHELTHIRREHWAYSYSENQKRSLGISLLLILTRSGRTAWDLASVGNDLIFNLPMSRKHETESDIHGLEMMIKAGYNPNAAPEVFQILQEANKGKGAPEWISTHPDDGKRIQRLKDEVAKKGDRNWPAMTPLPWKPSSEPSRTLRWNW